MPEGAGSKGPFSSKGDTPQVGHCFPLGLSVSLVLQTDQSKAAFPALPGSDRLDFHSTVVFHGLARVLEQ